jgi:hypothetical protein
MRFRVGFKSIKSSQLLEQRLSFIVERGFRGLIITIFFYLDFTLLNEAEVVCLALDMIQICALYVFFVFYF